MKTLVSNQFKQAYESLEESKRVKLREKIKQECGISKATFYFWVDDPSKINKPAKSIIAKIFKVPVEELFQ